MVETLGEYLFAHPETVYATVFCPFSEFFRLVYPQLTHTGIAELTADLLVNLDLDRHEEIIGIIRGGAYRRFASLPFFSPSVIQTVNQSVSRQPISDPLTAQVIRHAFNPNTDLDVMLFRSAGMTDPQIMANLAHTITESGLALTHEEPGKAGFSDGQSQVEISQITIGARAKHPLFGIYFFNPDCREAVFELHFCDFPRNQQELDDSIRLRADSDLNTIAFLCYQEDGGLYVLATPYVTHARLRGSAYWCLPTINQAGADLTTAAADVFRSINMRADFPATENTVQLTLNQLLAVYPDHPPPDAVIDQMIKNQESDIRDRLPEFLSDALYGLIINLPIALPMAYVTHGLRLMPLGRLIRNHDTLKQVMAALYRHLNIAKEDTLGQAGLSYFLHLQPRRNPRYKQVDPLILLDLLKECKLLSRTAPRTFETLVGLLNPQNCLDY